mmetsp:Transcript_27403/g.37768  ORF Transcript_27403/g.37768 Transcript_27403/m.37768 type:complete len:155 (-) Transcript_27403:148-612(-)
MKIDLFFLVTSIPCQEFFFEYNIQHVGHLESFEKDWARILPLINEGKNVPYDTKFGRHPTSMNFPVQTANATAGSSQTSKLSIPSSNDPNDARKSLLQLMKDDIRFAKAICHLVLVDYVCLPSYKLPKECEFLSNIRDVAVAAVREGKVIPYSI